MAKPLTDAQEQEKAIDDAMAGSEEVPDPPPYIVMEDEQPDRFKQMMSEGSPEGGAAVGMESMMRSINELPSRIMDAMRDG